MRYLAVAVVVLSSLVPCRAQNLLPNPEFDHDLSGWTQSTVSPPAFFWDNTQSVGPGGSVLIQPSSGPVNSCLEACVPVTAGVVYSFGGQYMFPSQDGVYELQMTVHFATNADCTGGLNQVYSPRPDPSVTPPGQWWVLAGPDATAPPQAVAALYQACQNASFGLKPTSSFDDLYFGPQGTVGPRQVANVPTLSWTGLFALVCGLSAAALWVLRKGRSNAGLGAR